MRIKGLGLEVWGIWGNGKESKSVKIYQSISRHTAILLHQITDSVTTCGQATGDRLEKFNEFNFNSLMRILKVTPVLALS